MSRSMFLAAMLLVTATGCPTARPTPTGATCPQGSTLTYDNFGKPFMENYCTDCHSSELKGKARHGAPIYHDFDTFLGIMQVANHIDSWSAAGPNAVNEIMPENDPKPSTEERYQLGEWIACERAKQGASDAGLPDGGAPDGSFDGGAVDAGVDAP